MLKILLLFIIAVIGLATSHLLVGHQGSVLIQTDTHNITMSITVLISLIIVFYLFVTLIWHLTQRLLRSPSDTLNWFRQRRFKREQHHFETIIQYLTMQNYLGARELLKEYHKTTPCAALPLLLAAANELNLSNYASANQYLTQAKRLIDKTEHPLVAYLEIRLALEQKLYNKLESLLLPWLKPTVPCAVFLRLAFQYYDVTQQYDLALETLAKLQKQLEYAMNNAAQLQQEIYSKWMQQILNNQGIEPLVDWWGKQKKQIVQQPELQTLLATLCLQAGKPELSEKFIIKYNQKNTNITLLSLLIKQPLAQPEKLTLLLQKKQQIAPDDLHLMRLLAYSLTASQQYQEAVTLLLTCVARYPNATDYWQLTKLYDALHNKTEAQSNRELTLQCYLEGKTDFPPFAEIALAKQYKKSLLDTL